MQLSKTDWAGQLRKQALVEWDRRGGSSHVGGHLLDGGIGAKTG
jgi:hypothetical protein